MVVFSGFASFFTTSAVDSCDFFQFSISTLDLPVCLLSHGAEVDEHAT